MVRLSLVELFPSQPVNLYPSFALAVIVTSAPSLYVPPSVDTVPPSAADTVNIYSIGSGVWTTGATDSSSSVEQLNISINYKKQKDNKETEYFIFSGLW